MGIEDALGDVTEVLGTIRAFLDDHPEAQAALTMALTRLQQSIREAQVAQRPASPTSAGAVRAMIGGAVGNLRDSQSDLEKFIQLSLTSSEAIVDLLGVLLGIGD